MMKFIPSARKQKQRGATMVLFTFLMVLVILPVLGLAVDGSIVMWEKARLSAAVDAAALAGGRALSVGNTPDAQKQSVISAGQTYFQANFQTGQMGTSVTNPNGQPIVDPEPSPTDPLARTVTVTANVNVPLYFLRLLGFTTASLQDSGQASRKDVNVFLVLDRSGSMWQPNAQVNPCLVMRAAAESFTNMFVDGRDQLSLITFQTTGNVDYLKTTTFKSSNPSLNSVLDQLTCAGGTNSAEALSLAHKQIINNPRIGPLNVVVFFSDGYPNAMTFGANGVNPLPVITQAGINQGQTDQRYGWADPNWGTSWPANNTLYNTVPSPCSSTSLQGVLTVYNTQNPDPNGLTGGVLDATPISISSSPANPPATSGPSSCTFNDTNDYNGAASAAMRNDVAYIPAADQYGNPTGQTMSPSGLIPPFRLIDTFRYGTSSSPVIRPDTPKGIVNSSFVAADNAAFQIRYDQNFDTVIYSIGLGSLVDNDFMARVANDTRSSSYDPNRRKGQYYYAPTASDLAAIFQQVASQVLRISQ